MGKSEAHPAIVFVGTVDSPSTVAATLAEKVDTSGDGASASTSSSSSSGGDDPVVQYVYELPQADEERLERLFKKLDRDNNGRIDIHDLSEALREVGMCHTYAEVNIYI